MSDAWLSSAEALRRLGLRPQTLYAYVSRGLVEARPDPGDPRRSLYRAADVEALGRRKARGRRPADVARGAIAWGEPVLTTAVSTVSRGRLLYRGQDAVALAEAASLEDAAALLWEAAPVQPRRVEPPAGPLKARLFAAVASLAGDAAPAAGRSDRLLVEDASEVLAAMAGAAAGSAGDEAAHLRLSRAWKADPDLLRRALVLLADHELNASTFAARVAASTGASLAASALAGLSALAGPRHGLHFLRVQALLLEARAVGPEAAVGGRLSRGAEAAGFGHPLYPEGDPRAAALLARLRPSALEAETIAAVREAGGQPPNIDFALCVLARAERLPEDAPFALFALGRCAGWIAHALEQHRTGALIRPRALYSGPRPD